MKLKTLNDLKNEFIKKEIEFVENDKKDIHIKEIAGYRLNILGNLFDKLKEEAIKWVKKDIEMSVDEFLYKKGFEEHLKWAKEKKYKKLPNGKLCYCDPEESCPFHREGLRMMKFFNIKEDDLGFKNGKNTKALV